MGQYHGHILPGPSLYRIGYWEPSAFFGWYGQTGTIPPFLHGVGRWIDGPWMRMDSHGRPWRSFGMTSSTATLTSIRGWGSPIRCISAPVRNWIRSGRIGMPPLGEAPKVDSPSTGRRRWFATVYTGFSSSTGSAAWSVSQSDSRYFDRHSEYLDCIGRVSFG